MKRISIIILVATLAISGIVIVNNVGSKYNQSSPVATTKSFISTLINCDGEGLTALTKDIIPWKYTVSYLLNYSMQNMTGTSINDYCYYQDENSNAIVVYNKTQTPEPQYGLVNGYAEYDFFCIDFVMSNNKFYVAKLVLPGNHTYIHKMAQTYDYEWDSICQTAIANKDKCVSFR